MIKHSKQAVIALAAVCCACSVHQSAEKDLATKVFPGLALYIVRNGKDAVLAYSDLLGHEVNGTFTRKGQLVNPCRLTAALKDGKSDRKIEITTTLDIQ